MPKTKEQIEVSTETKRSMFMRGFSCTYDDKPSFRLMPVDQKCPFLEGIYLPQEKILILISKDRKYKLEFIPKLDDNGDPIFQKVDPRAKGEPLFKRKQIGYDAQYDYSITDINEIKRFVESYAMDDPEFDFEKYF